MLVYLPEMHASLLLLQQVLETLVRPFPTATQLLIVRAFGLRPLKLSARWFRLPPLQKCQYLGRLRLRNLPILHQWVAMHHADQQGELCGQPLLRHREETTPC